MTKTTYKILKHDTDPLRAVIQKSGITAEFTLADLQTEQKQYKMAIEKYAAEKNNEEAKVANIQHFHPIVLELTPEQRFAVWMWQEASTGIDVCDKKIEAFQTELDLVEKTIKDVGKRLGLRSPEAAVDEAVAKIIEPENG